MTRPVSTLTVAITLAVSSSLTNLSHAELVATGTWDAKYTVEFRGNVQVSGDPGGTLDLSSGSATATVTSPYRPSTVTAKLTGTSVGNNGAIVPKIKSQLRIDLDANILDQSENGPAGRFLHIESQIIGDFSDTLSVANFQRKRGFIVVDFEWSGQFNRTMTEVEAKFDYKIESDSRLSVFINGAQQIAEISDPLETAPVLQGTIEHTDFVGIYSDTGNSGLIPFSPLDSGKKPSRVLIPIRDGQTTVPISLNYVDELALEFDVRPADRFYESLTMWAERDFSTTLNIRMGVQDENGNWLNDATIISSEGYTYETIPEPASVSLLASGLMLTLCRRRRC